MLRHKTHLSQGQEWGAAHENSIHEVLAPQSVARCGPGLNTHSLSKSPDNPTVSRANSEENGFTTSIHHTHDNYSAQGDACELFINSRILVT